MILSVSRRTDIPAYFSDWFYNRIEKGFVYVRNLVNIHQISRIDINPHVIECIVFWTKNPEYFSQHLHLLENYPYYFQYTVTGYGKNLEPNVPNLDDSISCFIKLSKLIGSKRVNWRYDPIIITNEFDVDYHKKQFEFIAQKLSGYTNTCIFSFVDYYKKTVRNLSQINYHQITLAQTKELAEHMSLVGKQYNLKIVSCAEEYDLSDQRIEHGKCIDDKLIEEISGFKLKVEKDKNQRKACNCVTSIDIGVYNTCLHGCLYCYANYNFDQARKNYANHDKSSELLLGRVTDDDTIYNKEVISNRVLQQKLFD